MSQALIIRCGKVECRGFLFAIGSHLFLAVVSGVIDALMIPHFEAFTGSSTA